MPNFCMVVCFIKYFFQKLLFSPIISLYLEVRGFIYSIICLNKNLSEYKAKIFFSQPVLLMFASGANPSGGQVHQSIYRCISYLYQSAINFHSGQQTFNGKQHILTSNSLWTACLSFLSAVLLVWITQMCSWRDEGMDQGKNDKIIHSPT